MQEILHVWLCVGESQQSLQAIGMVNCLSFSSTNQLLAVGLRDGPVQVLEWPSLVVKVSLEYAAPAE